MTRIPQRVSLAAQAAAILREDIASGVWLGWLPGEHQLCSRYQISRVTLRAALAQLQREGLVRSRQGRRREIAPGAVHRRGVKMAPRVVLLTPTPLDAMQPFALYWAGDLRDHLQEAGHHLEIQHWRLCYTAHPEGPLEAIARQFHPAGWILHQSTAPMQQWFAQRALPCLVVGSRHPGMELPSVDADYRAVCRHACGLLLARGHKHVALLNPESGLAGDRQSEAGFLEGVTSNASAGVKVSICNHDETTEGLCRRLDTLLGQLPRPTGLLVSKAHHALTALGHLTCLDLHAPQDLSLISRDDETFLRYVLPTLARYSIHPATMARKISRLVLEMARGGPLSVRDHWLIPRFVPGESLADCPLPRALRASRAEDRMYQDETGR